MPGQHGNTVEPCSSHGRVMVHRTRLYGVKYKGVRIHGESVTIAVTDKFCPRQIGLIVVICRRQAEQISTCNACRSEVFDLGSHMLRSNPSRVSVKVIS